MNCCIWDLSFPGEIFQRLRLGFHDRYLVNLYFRHGNPLRKTTAVHENCFSGGHSSKWSTDLYEAYFSRVDFLELENFTYTNKSFCRGRKRLRDSLQDQSSLRKLFYDLTSRPKVENYPNIMGISTKWFLGVWHLISGAWHGSCRRGKQDDTQPTLHPCDDKQLGVSLSWMGFCMNIRRQTPWMFEMVCFWEFL